MRSVYVMLSSRIVSLILPHAQAIIDICQRAMADQDRTDSTARLVFGIIGDLAAAFPNGEIKQALLTEWVATELRNRRYPSTTRSVQRYAREASIVWFIISPGIS